MQQAQLELLVIAAQGGNKKAYEILYLHYSPGMRRFALTLVPFGQAEDLVQSVWLKVFKRIHSLNDVSVFGSWLYRALRWEANDWLKQSYNSKKDSYDEGELEQINTTESKTDSNESEFLKAMTGLLLIEQQIIQLFYLQDMPIAQIALSLDIPVGTVKSRLHRARIALKRILENNNE
ncbi:MAG: RNA polymerase sigma-70 factor (ECF subfamily) [Alphaproteobacteria bacterium]|jgi:RNA polymerase sigma-70 factor (ECF subfamily)